MIYDTCFPKFVCLLSWEIAWSFGKLWDAITQWEWHAELSLLQGRARFWLQGAWGLVQSLAIDSIWIHMISWWKSGKHIRDGDPPVQLGGFTVDGTCQRMLPQEVGFCGCIIAGTQPMENCLVHLRKWCSWMMLLHKHIPIRYCSTATFEVENRSRA